MATRKARKVTIVEVARRAGVSLGTVSRVINRAETVGPELRERVLAAARALGYVPNPAARAIRSRSTRVVGVMVPDISNPLFGATVGGAEDLLYRAGYNMVLTNSRYEAAKEREILALFKSRQFDGMIVTPGDEHERALLELLAEWPAPVVLLERETRLSIDSVAADHYGGVRQAAGYLLELGHRRIGLITVTRAALTGRRRADAYLAAHRKAGVRVDPALLSFDGLVPEASYHAAYRMLSAAKPPTAIVAGANQMPEVLRAVRAQHLSVPKHVSLLSIGDTDVASLHQPPLTAVRWDLHKVGEAAAELLLARLGPAGKEGGARHVTLPTELVVRASCRAA